MQGIWVFLETQDGKVEEVSLEVLGKAIELAERKKTENAGVVMGYNLNETVKELQQYGMDKLYYVEHELLRNYDPHAYTKALHQLVEKYKPEIMLFGATYNGTDIAARLAIKAEAGLIAHVIDLAIEEGTGMLIGDVPGFGGNIVAVCKCRPGVLQIATVRPGVFSPAERKTSSKAEVITFNPQLSRDDAKLRTVEKKIEHRLDITRAEKVVIAGMGTGGDLTLVKKLAEKLGAEIAATRPLADIGVVSRDVQVGSTGYSLRSKLAIVAGVSGASHFVSGIRDVKTVIAINTDKNAPIFQFADYCVVGDLFKILPKLVDKLS